MESYHRSTVNQVMVNQYSHIQDFPDSDLVVDHHWLFNDRPYSKMSQAAKDILTPCTSVHVTFFCFQ